jgi:hypothetical protein
MLGCPYCKAALHGSERHCPYCRLVVSFDGGRARPIYPQIRPGNILCTLDLTRETVPGMSLTGKALSESVHFAPSPSGVMVTLAEHKSFESALPFVRRRDVCARARFQALDPSIVFHLVTRKEAVGEGSSQYAFAVSILKQSVRFERLISSAKKSTVSVIVDWQKHAAIVPGAAVDVELRALGPTLEGLVFGERVFITHEPTLGVGYPGIRITASGAPGRAAWTGFEVREVAS